MIADLSKSLCLIHLIAVLNIEYFGNIAATLKVMALFAVSMSLKHNFIHKRIVMKKAFYIEKNYHCKIRLSPAF